MAFPEYSKIAIPDSQEDEERPSSSRPPKVPPKKKTSIICGWTFWLFLLVLFTLAGVGFVLLKQDASHNFLARLSLGDVEADEERDSQYNKDLHKIQQDDSSDYSSSHDSGSSDSNDSTDNMETNTKDEEEESQDKQDEDESNVSSSEDNANDISEPNNADVNDRDDDAIGESISDEEEDEETEAAEDGDSNDSSSSSSSDSLDENKVEADDDSMMFSGDGDEEETENVSHTKSNAQDIQESNNDNAASGEAQEDPDENEAATADEDEDGENGSAAEDEHMSEEEEDDDSETEQDVQHAQDANLSGDSSTDGESMDGPPKAGVNSYDDESLPEEEIIAALAKRLEPKDLFYEQSEISDLRAHQFLHLHQMKTGGTSLDHYLRCAMDRLRRDKNLTIPYGNIHECSELKYSRCRDDKDPWCKERLANASFMSYCAPLKDLELFHWSTANDDIRAITVLRHPVDRVWSMYRFQTKSCFHCMNLTDIYDLLDHKRTGTFKQVCMKQLLNHETANMLSHSELLPKENAKYQEEPMASDLVNEAVTNMKSFFTAIGLTEELNRTVDLFGQVFPWFQSEVEWSDMTCELTHDNASPQNNHCGPDGTHWELPPHPDEATRKLIEEHNQLDIAVYEAAVQHFWRQNDAVFKGER